MPNPTFNWKIYYGDGTTYDGDQDPYLAPTTNAQIAVIADPNHGWTMQAYEGFYWYEPDMDAWIAGDSFGYNDYMLRDGPKKVIFGRTIDTAEFTRIMSVAINDPAIPVKSGWYPNEVGAP